MNGNLIWSITLAAIGIYGLYLAGSNNVAGWLIGLCSQVLWFIFAIVTAQYGFILSCLGYGFVYGRNYYRWRKDRSRVTPAQQ